MDNYANVIVIANSWGMESFCLQSNLVIIGKNIYNIKNNINYSERRGGFMRVWKDKYHVCVKKGF